MTETTVEDAVGYVRGYVDGHDQGNAAGAATQAIVQELQAAAWNAGYDVGHRDGTVETRADIGQVLTDLSVRYAEIDEAFGRFKRITHEQRIAERVAEMVESAARLHTQIGTSEWVGLDNGAVLPSADWKPSTAPLTDLKPGQRQIAIRQAGSMNRNGAAA